MDPDTLVVIVLSTILVILGAWCFLQGLRDLGEPE